MTALLTRARFARRIIPLQEVIFDALGFRSTATSKLALFDRYGAAAESGRAIANEMRDLSRRFFHIDPEVADVAPCPAQLAGGTPSELHALMTANLTRFSAELASTWECERIGRIELVADNACRFTYYDFQRRPGILTRTVNVVKHQHELINPRFHRLPAENVVKPARAKEMIRALHFLRPYARIVTGLEVAFGSEQSGSFTERTALGRTLDHATDSARTAGNTIVAASRTGAANAAAVSVGVAGAGAAAAWLLGSLSAAAIADPALVIGDHVLFGWE